MRFFFFFSFLIIVVILLLGPSISVGSSKQGISATHTCRTCPFPQSPQPPNIRHWLGTCFSSFKSWSAHISLPGHLSWWSRLHFVPNIIHQTPACVPRLARRSPCRHNGPSWRLGTSQGSRRSYFTFATIGVVPSDTHRQSCPFWPPISHPKSKSLSRKSSNENRCDSSPPIWLCKRPRILPQ